MYFDDFFQKGSRCIIIGIIIENLSLAVKAAMPKVSCATLETVMNLAALNSTYQGHEHIYKDDVTDALLQVVYKLQKADKETDSIELQKIALHEAAHAVVPSITMKMKSAEFSWEMKHRSRSNRQL